MPAHKTFLREFSHVSQVLAQAENVLLVAHSRPDPDAVGSVVALKRYIEKNYTCRVVMGCFHPFPHFLSPALGQEVFEILDGNQIEIDSFDLAIGCDSVDRGFDMVQQYLDPDCITVAFDHHHDISLETDVSLIDPFYASTTELLYTYFLSDGGEIDEPIATALLTGIIGDTGIFQHSNTSPHVLNVSAELVRKGASVSKIVNASFTHQKIETLNLWGRALERARYNEDSGIVTTALTMEDTLGKQPSSEEIKEVATILANAPSVRAALIIFQVGNQLIKASLRAHKDAKIDVSAIAHQFGGGGHPLAAGFEMPGRIKILPTGGWEVV